MTKGLWRAHLGRRREHRPERGIMDVAVVELAVAIIIGLLIRKAKQSKNYGSAKQGNTQKQAPSGSDAYWAQTSAKEKAAAGKRTNASSAVTKPSYSSGNSASSASAGSGASTTDYLKKKAEEDARAHAKEKREEDERLRISYGGLRAAERYLDGDSVPSGKRIVRCSYCYADNLVPFAFHEPMSCYFCREKL